MILITLNFRGLASLPKQLAVKRLIDEKSLDAIYLQENMFDGCILVKERELLLKHRQYVSVDAKGRSGGLLLGWRFHNFLLLNAWSMTSGLCAVLHSIELKKDLSFINLYGPYSDREFFWNNLSCMGCSNVLIWFLGEI